MPLEVITSVRASENPEGAPVGIAGTDPTREAVQPGVRWLEIDVGEGRWLLDVRRPAVRERWPGSERGGGGEQGSVERCTRAVGCDMGEGAVGVDQVTAARAGRGSVPCYGLESRTAVGAAGVLKL